jgi:nitrite reductase/ring-hydroxylating ferredoxin subunit
MARERFRVLHRDSLPIGKLAYVDVEGLPIAIANVNGIIYAFGDSCRHEGGPLSAGALIEGTVTCPWHGWTYDVRTGKSIVPPIGIRVPTYPVVVEGDDIFVEIDWS